MPILPPEPNLYPSDLLETPSSRGPGAGSNEGRWLVVHTKPRQEKSLARQARAAEIPFYLPLIPKQLRVRGRIVRSFAPLFSGYLFANVDEQQRVQLLQTNRVTDILSVPDDEQLTEELRHLDRLIAADAPLSIERKLSRGRRVRVKSGPFAGIEGTVISRRGKDRLLVAVTLLQQGASVEIDDFQVEPVY